MIYSYRVYIIEENGAIRPFGLGHDYLTRSRAESVVDSFKRIFPTASFTIRRHMIRG